MIGGGAEWGEDTFTNDSPPASITLTMRQGPNPGQRFTVRKENVAVGRLPGNDISIPDSQVSRHHANITWENGQWVIRDLGSANGTAVNGTAITDACPLRDGDVIALGEIVLTFQGSAILAAPGEEDEAEDFVRPTAPQLFPPPRGFAPPGGTVAMPPSVQETSGSNIWPVLIGIGLALFFALIVVAAVLYIVLSQSQAAPEIRVQQPASGSEAKAGEPLLILASAMGKGVTRAELWVDGTLNASIPSNRPEGQPVLFVQQQWTPNTAGLHVLTLRAFNAAGKASPPQEISVTVAEATANQAPPPTPPRDEHPAASAGAALPATLAAVAQTPTPLPTATALSCTNDAAFVADVTVPDNTVFRSGNRIDKTWRLRNSGSCPWNDGYRLIFISGNKLGAPDNQPVVSTAPGGTTDVTVTMYAPSAPGVYTGVWRLVDASGQPFGQSFTVVIQVPSPFTPTPAVPPTNTPLPGPIVNLSVDKDRVTAGECTILHATVEGVSSAWLAGEAVVGGRKDLQVCPCEETTYELDAALASGDHVKRQVTVKVDGGTCTSTKPDLVIREISADDTTPAKGDSVHLKMRIKNQGGSKARDFSVYWAPKGASGDWKIVEDEISLAAGDDEWIEWDYTYSDSGKFKTEARVDYHDDVDESDEDNNSRTLTITVSSD